MAGTTVNDVTLLSTDYCNHLGEVVMLFSMVADMPVLIEDVKSWRPKSYADHFRDSGLSIGPLAIQSYDVCEAKYRRPFDAEVAAFNDRVASGCAELVSVIESGDSDRIGFFANDLSQELQKIMDRIAAIANGAILDDAGPADDAADEEKGSLNQDDVDALF